jgi:hypothetical protein
VVGVAILAAAALGVMFISGWQFFTAPSESAAGLIQSESLQDTVQTAVLRISITGLPADAEGTFVLVDETGKAEKYPFTGSASVEVSLASGEYRLDFGDAVAGPDHFYPLPAASMEIAVDLVEANRVEAEYAALLLTFSGLGRVELGMTLEEVEAADPSVRQSDASSESDDSSECVIAASNEAQALVFNPDGRLVYIEPKNYVPTEQGIRAGSTGPEVQDAYRLRFKTYQLEGFPGVYIDINGAEADFTAWSPPYLGIEFGDSGALENEWEGNVADATVQGLVLDNGQECFG